MSRTSDKYLVNGLVISRLLHAIDTTMTRAYLTSICDHISWDTPLNFIIIKSASQIKAKSCTQETAHKTEINKTKTKIADTKQANRRRRNKICICAMRKSFAPMYININGQMGIDRIVEQVKRVCLCVFFSTFIHCLFFLSQRLHLFFPLDIKSMRRCFPSHTNRCVDV